MKPSSDAPCPVSVLRSTAVGDCPVETLLTLYVERVTEKPENLDFQLRTWQILLSPLMPSSMVTSHEESIKTNSYIIWLILISWVTVIMSKFPVEIVFHLLMFWFLVLFFFLSSCKYLLSTSKTKPINASWPPNVHDAKAGEFLKPERAPAVRCGITFLLPPPAPHASAEAAALWSFARHDAAWGFFCSYFRHRHCTAAKFTDIFVWFFITSSKWVFFFIFHTKLNIFTLPRSTKRHLALALRLSAQPSRSISYERCQLPGRVQGGGGPDLFTKSSSKTISVEQTQLLQS